MNKIKILVIVGILVLGGIGVGVYMNKDKIISILSPQAKGLVVLSKQDAYEKNKEIAKQKADKQYSFDVKIEKETVILKQSDVKELHKLGFISEYKNEETKKIDNLSFKKDSMTLWAKKETTKVEVAGQTLSVEYGGDKLIGEGRVFGSQILILPDTSFDSIKATSYKLMCLQYGKNSPKKDVGFGENGTYRTIETQLTSLYK